MGTWSTSILGNDSSSDVYDDFMNNYYDGVPLETIKKSIADKFGIDERKGLIADDRINYWLGYCSALCEVNLLSKEMVQIVREIIESGADLKEWKDLGASEASLIEREAVAKEFLEEVLVLSQKPTRKDVIAKRKKKKKTVEYFSTLRSGEIFQFPMHLSIRDYFDYYKLGGIPCKEWGYGRVLLNAYYQRIAQEKNENNPNYNPLFKNAIWVEIYRETSTLETQIPDEFTVLIPSLGVGGLQANVVGFRPVDVEKVVFQETIANRNELFIGELRIKFPSSQEADAIEISPGLDASAAFDRMVLANTNREAEIEVNPNHHKLVNKDLRFHPSREAILRSANIDPNYSYYELALSYGVDLKRLFLETQLKKKIENKQSD